MSLEPDRTREHAVREPLLERLSWPEVAAALDAGRRTVLLPCGAVEQHGPHLPLLVDAEHARALGLAIGERLGACLVAPTIQLGCSSHHMGFAGTISIGPETLKRVLRDTARSLSAHGFEAICCFSTHGGNYPVLREAESPIDDELGSACRFVAYTDQVGFLRRWRDTAERWGNLGGQVGGHADVVESSIALALEPDLVQRDAVKPQLFDEDDERLAERIRREGVAAVSQNGVIGDPAGMSPELGEACIADMAAMLAEFFRSRLREGGT